MGLLDGNKDPVIRRGPTPIIEWHAGKPAPWMEDVRPLAEDIKQTGVEPDIAPAEPDTSPQIESA